MCTCGSLNEYVSYQITLKVCDYNVKECKSCGFIETTPLAYTGVDIYETGHYQVKPYFFIPVLINLADFIITFFSIKRLKISKNSSFLDFGCGKGYFLYFLNKIGYKKLAGVETSVSRASFAREITGIEIGSDFYSGGTIFGKKYDCITMIHVLEHIKNPFVFLDTLIGSTVNHNGIVYIEVPNINSVASKIAGTTWAHFTPHFHTNHFTVKAFIKYCILKNYEYELVSTFSFYNSAMGMSSAILSLFGYKGSIFEDLKGKKIHIIISFVLLLPFTVLVEALVSLFLKKGSVIKFAIKNR
jgi:2-polyprenyl-3-methyl-5-hydroxy-6-metoxy-1,4-benzoquinol methylase